MLVLAATACVPPDEETATFAPADGAEQTLPSVTQAPDGPDDDPAAEPDDEPDDEEAGEPAAADGDGDGEPATTSTAPLAELQGLTTELLAADFDQPILVTGAPGTDALFVVEREGVIRVVEDSRVRDEPFLDLTGQLLSSSIEQGLLGLAFHPDYATNGVLFAYWTDPAGDSLLARFEATAPTELDPESLEVVLQVDQPAERHNAGMLEFGPDGLLYLALGDGGGGGATSQDTSDPLGSILRLDVGVDGRGDSTRPYAIPAGNPFDDEIWVYGLRNPWRFSIDEVTETVYIGDVGQDRWEEVNVVGLDGAGTNFGWFQTEGDQCFRSDCDTAGLTDPILQYSHDEGCSITGGRVYRGQAIPELTGHYLYADWCGGLVRSFRLTDRGQVADQLDWSDELGSLGQVTSFGVDGDGELLVVNWAGELHRILPVR
ncbi:MAG: PQQ-dependent sugar dehydrogenase [Actinomycetota bacterium]